MGAYDQTKKPGQLQPATPNDEARNPNDEGNPKLEARRKGLFSDFVLRASFVIRASDLGLCQRRSARLRGLPDIVAPPG
jgi:hypothetical protein